MIPRIERSGQPLKREVLRRRRRPFAPSPSEQNPELALVYSNGYVTVEISQEAIDAYVDAYGDVPLPVADDAETGDRRIYDARNKVRVVYDAEAKVREICKRSSDGLFVRINFSDEADGEPA